VHYVLHMTDELMTSTEVCEALGISAATLSRWVAKGHIVPAVKSPGLRGAYHFTAAEVERVKIPTP
jgi:excisionase family DNA binding protein